MSPSLPVYERFLTFQGEGIHMGLPAFFIRLHGCPIHCPWCDSAGTWHPDWVPAGVQRIVPERLACEAKRSGVQIVVVTGGEPTIHDLVSLVWSCHDSELRVHLETSGAFPILGMFDWITLSPKRWRMPLAENVLKANEIKVIVEQPGDIPYYIGWLSDCRVLSGCPVWLHPEWSKRHDVDVLRAIVEAVKSGRGLLRAGYQIHRLYGVDMLDERVREPVPLGGNPEKGF